MSKIDKVKLSVIRKLIKGQIDLEAYTSVKARIAECYNRPDNVDLTLKVTIHNVYLTTDTGDEYTAKVAKLYSRYISIKGIQISLDEVVRLDYDLEGVNA